MHVDSCVLLAVSTFEKKNMAIDKALKIKTDTLVNSPLFLFKISKVINNTFYEYLIPTFTEIYKKYPKEQSETLHLLIFSLT